MRSRFKAGREPPRSGKGDTALPEANSSWCTNSVPKALYMPTRLSTREASEYLSLPESTLRYYRHIGKGPASYMMGRKVFYDVTDLDEFIRAQKAATVRGGDGVDA